MSGVYGDLPEKYITRSSSNIRTPLDYIEKLIKRDTPLRNENRQTVDEQLKFQFILEKFQSQQKHHRPIRKKKSFLTRKERVQLELLKLPKSEWNYRSLAPLRAVWQQYMRQNLDCVAIRAPDCVEADWPNVSTILARSELIGAEVTVVRSTVPTYVGITGTVVLETKMTFQIVTARGAQLKIVTKASAVFEFVLAEPPMRLIVFGKHLVARPSERSVRKIKSSMVPDL